MGAIDDLKDLLHNTFNDGRVAYPCVVNEKMNKPLKLIRLFYQSGLSYVNNRKAPYYNNVIQVAVRSNKYNDARDIAYQALEHINRNSKSESSAYFSNNNIPEFIGEDAQIGGFVWAFDITARGAK
jgi:hypothetical protein